jgi:PAS domain S-box-containing protein
MDGNSLSNQELLQEVQELRRQVAAAQEAARAREEALRRKLRRAVAEQRRLTAALKEAEAEHQRLSVTFQTLAGELQAANDELATQSEQLQIQNEELLNQNDQLQVQARLLADQKQEQERLARKLEEERALLQAALEQMPASVVMAAAPAGPIFLTNQRAVELWPYPLAACTDLDTFWRIPRYHPDGRAYRVKEMPLHRSLTLGEVVADEEFFLQPKDGSPIHLSVSSAPVRDHQGRIVAGVTTHFDITARKQAEPALRESEARYRSLVELSPDAILVHTAAGKIIFINSAALKLFGASSPEDLLGKPAIDLAHPDVVKKVRDRINNALVGGKSDQEEFKVIRLDGQVVEVEAVGSSIIFQGEPAVQMVCRDITERKRAEAALRDREEELAAIYDNAPLIMMLLDEERRVRKLNRFAAQFAGAPAADLHGRRGGEALCCWHALDDPQGCGFGPHCRQCPARRTIIATFETGIGHHQVEATLTFTLNGKPQDVTCLLSTALFKIQGQPRVLVTIQDITARRQAEEALRASEAREWDRAEELQAVLDAVPVTILLTHDPDACLITGNAAAYEQLRLPPGSNMSKSAPEDERPSHFMVMKDGREVAPQEMPLQRATASGESTKDYEFDLVFSDGAVRHMLGNVVPLWGEDGRPRGAVAAFLDLTERKQAQEGLRRAHAQLEERVRERTADLRATVAQLQEEVQERQRAEEALKTERQRFYSVLERIPAYVALIAPNCTIPYSNREFKRRFGDPGNRLCYEFLLGLEAPCEGCQALEVFKTNTPAIWEWAGPDGNTYQIYDHPFTDVDGSPLVLELGVDITRLKQAEQQAVSLGRMYRMLSQVNETIVRAQDQETLFRQVCRIMMETGDFLLAWVGLVDRETRLLKAATQFDLMDEYLQNLTIPLDDIPEGRGPTGTAVREGRFDVCHDIAADPRMAPWREQALVRGFRSSAAFPLRVGAKIVGALTVYAGRPKFFTEDEIALLESLADDLAFALDFMDREARRHRAEAALRESEERLRHLASQLLHAQERERHRLALELHDDLGQSLMVLKMQIRGIEKMLTPAQWQIKQQCDQTLAYLTGVVDNVRRLSRDLRPSILEDLGLPAALQVLADEFGKYYEVELSLDMDDIGDLFSREEEINIYRIFQECLTNIAKHARASRVAITIKRHDGRVAFRVEDNGRGFDLERALTADPPSRGLGLSALEERVHMLGGALEIRSEADRGTTIAFAVPLAAAD